MLAALLLFFLILSFLVFIHELGHFLSARKFGVKVEEFGLGIPPKAWGKKIGGTEYTLNWLPIGGFVRLLGEDFEGYDPHDKQNFINKRPWQKSIILLAGITMNFLFAIIVFYVTLATNNWRSTPLIVLTDYQFPFGNKVEVTNVVMALSEGSPAEKAGIDYGDRITKLATATETTEPKNTQELIDFVGNKAGQEIAVSVENINSGDETVYKITPEFNESVNRATLGVQLGQVNQIDYSKPSQKLFAGFEHAVNIIGYSGKVMGSLISTSYKTKDLKPVAQGVSGPVGIFGAVQAITAVGGRNFLTSIFDLTALLSLSLAVMNFLPFPALDGGRWVFVLYEWISGKKPSQKLEARAHQIGFAILLAFIVLVTFKDIFQFLI